MEVNKHLSGKAREDYALVERYKETNNQAALSELMSRYRDSIYYMILKMVHTHEDAEDLTVEAFTKAFMNLEKYTPTYAFSTWLFRIASNNVIDFLRKKRIDTISLHAQRDEDGKEVMAGKIKSEAPNPEDIFIKSQRAEILRKVLKTINPKYAQLIALRYFKELSYDEISKELNMPIGTVKVKLHRAKKMIRSLLQNSPLKNS
ncbi:MAG: sigma-70 family RNA polymerase sigma factor [Bacteroidetes bacterium]|nr:sigma-70 family RNA polymerase sigma factor [Bacteroidota bacterium]